MQRSFGVAGDDLAKDEPTLCDSQQLNIHNINTIARLAIHVRDAVQKVHYHIVYG